MKFIIVLSLLVAVVSAAPAINENEEISNAIIESNDDLLDSPMLEFETDYELNKFELLEFLPDQVRDKIVEQLRITAVQVKLKVLGLVRKIEQEVEKLNAAWHKTRNAITKTKIWAQVQSLRLLKTVTLAGLDKFDVYIVNENSRVLENLVRSLERLFETKFFKYTTLAKVSYKLVRSIEMK